MPNFDQLEPNENATSSQLESHVSISYLDETSKKSYLHWIPNKQILHMNRMSVQQVNMSASSKPSYGGSSYVLGPKHLFTSELIISY